MPASTFNAGPAAAPPATADIKRPQPRATNLLCIACVAAPLPSSRQRRQREWLVQHASTAVEGSSVRIASCIVSAAR